MDKEKATEKSSPASDSHCENKGSTPAPGRQTKTERALLVMVSTPKGVTENDILRSCGLSSGRNYPNLLERETGIALERIPEPNPDGIGSHYRYRLCSLEDAQKAIGAINKRRVARKAPPLSDSEVDRLTRPYAAMALQKESP